MSNSQFVLQSYLHTLVEAQHIAVQYFFVIWSLKYSPAFSSQTHDFVDFQVLGQSVCGLRCQMDV